MSKKILALHLPAFHQIPENDEWWGEGFTEWTNVKAGKQLFKGHSQPIKPLNDNYYDLSKKEDIERQIRLAQKYGVNGFVFYHYWFGNGKMLFERPVEIIKDEIEMDFDYCFCWANQTWLTTWHGMTPRTLLKQEYPGKKDWELHFQYLRDFFMDERYIKVDNKPMFFIYNPSEIPNYNEMVEFYDSKCKEIGLDGIYVVEYIFPRNKDLYSEISDAVFEFEPRYTLFFDVTKLKLVLRALKKRLGMTDFQSYDYIWKKIVNRKRTYKGKTIITGCFVGWDNSPRNGKNSIIVRGKSSDKFKKYFQMFYDTKRKDASNEFCVINAWNEWSEGAYLEPDTCDKYAYLEVIRDIKKLENKNVQCTDIDVNL